MTVSCAAPRASSAARRRRVGDPIPSAARTSGLVQVRTQPVTGAWQRRFRARCGRGQRSRGTATGERQRQLLPDAPDAARGVVVFDVAQACPIDTRG